MKILIIGSGGREHAISWKLSQSPKVEKIYAAPGNIGMKNIAELVDINAEDIHGLLNFAKNEKIDLTVVGPENPLVLGISDLFEENGLKIFGPNKSCARLEGSKAFAKDFMIRHEINTAKYKEFTSADKAVSEIDSFGYPVVIKADGLAAGKGVIIAANKEEAVRTLEELMVNKKFGEAGNKVVIEEFLTGIEASILCFVDENTILPMESAQDYKKALDGDLGLNTGGMGTYSPSLLFDETMMDKVKKEVLVPFHNGLKKDNMKFRGIIFIGLMIEGEDIKVLEFNVRFGDPETQSILLRMESDLCDVFEKTVEGRLNEVDLKWKEDKTVCVVMASGGYPESYEKNKEITGITDDMIVFHSGTKEFEGKIVTNGGRVLGVMGFGKTLENARSMAYGNVNKISFEKAHFRKDIGTIVTK